MKISAKSDYALRAMLELALAERNGSSNIFEIAKRQNIPKRYLEHLLLALKQAGLVTSSRGKEGGYRLNRQPGSIKIGDIIRAIEGSVDILPGTPASTKNKKDIVSGVWDSIQTAIGEVLNSITLEDLVNKKKKAEKTLTYYI